MPVKFVVTELSLAVALQVGQATFGLFTKVEWLFAGALLALSLPRWRRRALRLAFSAGLGIIVVLQGVWLLPVLDARVAAIVAGEMPPPSAHHALYAGLEGLKAAMLFGAAVVFLRALREIPGGLNAPAARGA